MHPPRAVPRTARGAAACTGFARGAPPAYHRAFHRLRKTPMTLRHAVLPLLVAAALATVTPPSSAAERGLQARDLATMDRFSSPTLSADGRHVVFAKRVVDAAAGTSTTSLWIEDLFARDAAPPRRLTPEGWNVNSPSFSPDGREVYFLSAKSGRSQLYSIGLAGGEPRLRTEFPVDIGTYRIAPGGGRIAFSADTFRDCASDLACTRTRLDDDAKRTSTGVLYDGLFVRHWDTWADGRRNQLFVAELGTAPSTRAVAVSGALDGDVPSKPFGSVADYTWAPDGQSLVASLRVAGRSEPWSTNFDLYRLQADGQGTARNLTSGNPAWDAEPGVQRRRRHAVLPRDEARRVRGRPFRADGHGPVERAGARDRARLGPLGRRHRAVRRRHHDLHHRPGHRRAPAVRGRHRQRAGARSGRRRHGVQRAAGRSDAGVHPQHHGHRRPDHHHRPGCRAAARDHPRRRATAGRHRGLR